MCEENLRGHIAVSQWSACGPCVCWRCLEQENAKLAVLWSHCALQLAFQDHIHLQENTGQ